MTDDGKEIHTAERNPGMDRRGFLKRAVIVGLAATVGSIPEGEERFPLTSDPIDVQIREFEQKHNKLENLNDRQLRNQYAWMLSVWFNDKTSGVFVDESDPYAVATKIYTSTHYVENEDDPNFKDHEHDAGWAYRQEEIYLNLTSRQFNEQSVETKGGATLPILVLFRDTLSHEIIHFMAIPREEAESFNLIRELNPGYQNYANTEIAGFAAYFVTNPNNPESEFKTFFSDFDEASTEFIANYYQRTSAFVVGPPSYDNPDRPGIEKAINLLEATLKIADISVEDFAKLHAHSDLDGLATALADVTTHQFNNNTDKIRYGLSIIVAMEKGDRKTLGQYFQETKS